jgi:hypothetical protein
VKRLALLLLLFPLAACQTTGGGSVAGSCTLFERPPYAVRGARSYDQDWIDSTIEGGIGGCKWARPAARPAELDAAPAPKPRPVAKPAKKRSWVKRVKAKVWSNASVAPVAIVPEPIEAAIPVPPSPPPAPPRSAIDELLHPESK